MLGYDQLSHALELFTGVPLPTSQWETRPATQVVAQLVSKASDPADVDWLQTHDEWSPGARR